MNEMITLINSLLDLAFQLIALGLVVVSIGVVGIAVWGMARNRTAAWDNILFVPIVLLMGAGLLMYYPQIATKAARTGLEKARPEADALRTELDYWRPQFTEGEAGQQIAPVDSLPPTPGTTIDTSQPAVVSTVPVAAVQPQATYTPYPTYTSVPAQPTQIPPTAVPTATPCIARVSPDVIISCPPTPPPPGN